MKQGNNYEGRMSADGLAFLRQHGFQALLFDWDGVLIDSVFNYYRAYEMVFQDAGIVTSPREIYLREGQPTPQLLRAIFDLRGIAVDDARIKEMVERRREYDARLAGRKFFPGVPELLIQLRAAGVRVAMVTGSSRKSVERVLNAEQAQWFELMITADDVVHSKPDPEPFLKAASALNVDPSRCLVVENAPFGIEAGCSAGCRVVAICTTLPADDLRQADWVVQSHDDLDRLLGSGPFNRDHEAEASVRGAE
jgi:beta-phosphoglucomutase